MQPNLKKRMQVSRQGAGTRCVTSRVARLAAWWAALLLAVVVCVNAGVSARALEPTTPVKRMGRQAWTMENGLPQNTVQALVAAKSGFLWLGTEVGLVRFDGYAFLTLSASTRPRFAASDVRGIFEGRDNALWVATGDGLTRIEGEKARVFTTQDGLPEGTIHGIAERAGGGLWVWSESGVVELVGEKFVKLDGLQGASVRSVAVDREGRLWAATNEGVSVLRDGKWTEFRGGACRVSGPGFVEATDEGLWVACTGGTMLETGGPTGYAWNEKAPGENWRELVKREEMPTGRVEFVMPVSNGGLAIASATELVVVRGSQVVERASTRKELAGTRIQVVKADREGALWVGTNRGLARWVGGRLESLPVSDPLANASVLAVDEDREGNLWVGTEQSGLEILRDERFRVIGTAEGLSSDAVTTVVEDAAGALWVGTNGGGLNVMRQGHVETQGTVQTLTTKNGLLSDVILSLAAGREGELWVGTPDGLNRVRGGQVKAFTAADGLPDDFVRSLLADGDGSLWVGTRRGLVHWQGERAIATLTKNDGLGSDLVGAMARDGAGRLWIATLEGLSCLERGRIRNYTTQDGLPSNIITALEVNSDGRLLIGTADHGWSIWDGQRFSKVESGTEKGSAIHAILEDKLGETWFATANSIAKCKLKSGSAECDGWTEFGAADGLRSREMAKNSHPSAWRGVSGLLWFATPKGLVEVDPAHFHLNALPPPVVIERLGVDDQNDFWTGSQATQTTARFSVSDGSPESRVSKADNNFLQVSAGHVHFEFEYAALSFSAPQKLRYRYKLEGFDQQWIEAGARRTAYYTNIPPGKYIFRVQAANNDGVWNVSGTFLTFELKPHFYQTRIFWLVVVLLLIALGVTAAVGMQRRRLMRAEREFNAVLSERSRIAREIHDTLAQGYVGISVQLEVLTELTKHGKPEALGKQLNALRGYVRDGLQDARQSIWALRSPDVEERTLPVELQRLVEQAGDTQLTAQLRIHGAYRPLKTETERELLRIAQEAIRNVKKHAAARRLEVELDYFLEAGGVALEIRDDGRGVQSELAEAWKGGAQPQSPAGHFGLTGMTERAAAIGAKLRMSSEAGKGTTVRVEVAESGERA
jgi:ligand-binding sensor domain-containing protein/signal transduction histidine kinase